MEKSDKQIAAEFECYCKEAEQRRLYAESLTRMYARFAGTGAACCDTGSRSWGHAHDSWCQLADETGQNTSGHARMYVCPDCGAHTVDASHAIACSMPGNRYRNMANQ